MIAHGGHSHFPDFYRPLDRRQQGRDEGRSSGHVHDAETAPVPATHTNGRGDILHHDERSCTESSPVCLNQERLRIARRGQSSTVAEDAPIAAIGFVPLRIFSLWLREDLIVGRQIAIFINRDRKPDAFIAPSECVYIPTTP